MPFLVDDEIPIVPVQARPESFDRAPVAGRAVVPQADIAETWLKIARIAEYLSLWTIFD